MNKYYIKPFILLLFIVLAVIGLHSCTDLSSNTEKNQDPNTHKINITNPQNNTTISEGSSNLYYNVVEPYSTKFIELYVNDNFVKNIPPKPDGSLPAITIEVSQNLIGQKIKLHLIYYDTDGKSYKSNTIDKLLVVKDNRAPFKPYNMVLTKFDNGSCNISWKDSSNYVDKYELWRKVDFTGEYLLHQDLSGNSFNTNDYGLDSNKIYFYKIRGLNGSSASEFSDEINTEGIVTSGNLYPPSNLSASILWNTTVILNWNDNSENENYFVVERSSNNIEFSNITVLLKNSISFRDSSGITVGSTYFYRIKSFSNTDSAISNTTSIRVTSHYLIAPSNLSANYNSTVGVIELSWQNNDSNTLFIDIERKTENSNFTSLKRVTAGSSIYLDFDVSINQIYTFRIRGYDLNNYSNYSNEVTISTF